MSLEVRSLWLRCHVGRGPRQPQALGAVVSEARTLRLDLRSGEHSPSRIRCSRRRRRERAHRREEEVATVDRAPTVLGDLDLLGGRGQAGGARSPPLGQHCPTCPGVHSVLGLPGGASRRTGRWRRAPGPVRGELDPNVPGRPTFGEVPRHVGVAVRAGEQGHDEGGRAGSRWAGRLVTGSCGRRDLNSHPRRDRDLNPARLPFRHARVGDKRSESPGGRSG